MLMKQNVNNDVTKDSPICWSQSTVKLLQRRNTVFSRFNYLGCNLECFAARFAKSCNRKITKGLQYPYA